MVRRRALWLPLLLVLLLVLLHGGCGGVVAGWDEGQVVEVDDEDRELSFAEMEERDLPGEDAVPAETFLEQQMCLSAQDTAAAKESDHATRQKLQKCLIESGCPKTHDAAGQQCLQKCRARTVDLLVAKHMKQFQDALFSNRLVRCPGGSGGASPHGLTARMAQALQQSAPGKKERKAKAQKKSKQSAKEAKASKGKQLKKAVKSAIGKMRKSTQAKKKEKKQEKKKGKVAGASKKALKKAVKRSTLKQKTDKEVARVARKEKLCGREGGPCGNAKKSKIRCNKDDMAEMRKSFKEMTKTAAVAQKALQAVSVARKAEESCGKNKHQVVTQFVKRRDSAVEKNKAQAKEKIARSRKTFKDVKKIRKELKRVVHKEDALKKFHHHLLQLGHQLKREIQKADEEKWKLERKETKKAAEPLDRKLIAQRGVSAAAAAKDRIVEELDATEHLVSKREAELKEKLVDVTSKMAIAQSELKQLEAERKKLTHMEKVNMERARDDIQQGHKLVAEAREFRSNDFDPSHKQDKALARLFKRQEIGKANHALAHKKYKLANAEYRYREAKVVELRASYAKYKERCKPVESDKATTEKLTDVEMHYKKAQARLQKAKKAWEVAKEVFKKAKKLDKSVLRASKELFHKGSALADKKDCPLRRQRQKMQALQRLASLQEADAENFDVDEALEDTVLFVEESEQDGGELDDC